VPFPAEGGGSFHLPDEFGTVMMARGARRAIAVIDPHLPAGLAVNVRENGLAPAMLEPHGP